MPMFIREAMRKNKVATAGAGVVLIAVAGWVMVTQVRAIQNDRPMPVNSRAFFTSDDGASWFADEAQRLTPFDHNGRPAVKAYVWRCDGGKPFITYLERINPESKARIDRLRNGTEPEPSVSEAAANPLGMPQGLESQSSGATSRPVASRVEPRGVLEFTLSRDLQVKKAGTGEGGWVKSDGPEGRKIARTQCPDGSTGDMEPVLP
jgi:hypothetical protein